MKTRKDISLRYAAVWAAEAATLLPDLIACCRDAAQKGNLPVKMTFFLDGSDPEYFLQTKTALKQGITEHFKEATPLLTFIGQRPLQGAISVELTLLEGNDTSFHLSCKTVDQLRYIVAASSQSTWLFLGIDHDPQTGEDFRQVVTTTFEAARQILAQEGMTFQHVIRQWNYIENITATTRAAAKEYQNYQVFNDIRALFYRESGLCDNFPAATGIGCDTGGFVLEIIALKGKNEVQIFPIKSPVQHNAYDYTKEVLIGDALHHARKQPPLFERAKMVVQQDNGMVFVSGTAAINGEASISIPDAAQQTEITILNMLELLTAGNFRHCGIPKEPDRSTPTYARVYVKHSEHAAAVEKACQPHFKDTPFLLLQADVCRSELLVEIEAAFEGRLILPILKQATMTNSSTTQWPIELVKKAYRDVPAYREWVSRQGVDPAGIQTMEDFAALPVMDKAYLTENARTHLFTSGALPVSASCSSGSSGKPTYWFRSEADDAASSKGYKHLIADVLNIRKDESVLALVCFAMGSWVAGTLTVDCLKRIAEEGYQLTIFPAGIEREDGLNALQNLGPEFDRILIYGYPPLLLDFVKAASERQIPMGEKVCLIPAGDKNSEQWREIIAQLAGCPQEQVVSFYGSADALYMACETPLSLAIKKEALQNPPLYEALFGEVHPASMPGMYQYDEDRLYLEEVNNELVLTIDRTLPLIRYNLRDRVKIVPHSAMRALLNKVPVQNEKIASLLEAWQKPFVVVGSRTDVAVNYYGINIYYDHIKNITDHPALSSVLSGSYMAYIENKYAESVQHFHIEFELNSGLSANEALQEFVFATTLQVLKDSSSEFRKLYENLLRKADPIVKVVEHGALELNGVHIGIYALKGKKPRMVNNKKP